MPLFGEDLGMYETPDGRHVSLPSQLAAGFPGLKPAQPPQLPFGGAPAFSPTDQSNLAALTPPPDASAAPVTLPAQVLPTAPPGPQAPRGAVTGPAQASDSGPPNTGSTPAPVTNDQLAKLGTAGGQNAEQAALGGERSAAQREGEALAKQATVVGNAMATRDEVAQQQLEKQQADANAEHQAIQADTLAYKREAKAIADTKIDRSVDHPVLAAIAVALGGIGQALQHKEGNPALDMLFKVIDRKVAGQMQDLDKRRQGLGDQKDALGMRRDENRDRQAELDKYRLAGIEQARRQVETIKQQTSSDVVRAHTDSILAGFGMKSAEILNGAIGREQQKREAEAARNQTAQLHRESIGVQVRGQNLEQGRFYAGLEEKRQEKAAEIAEKISLATGKNKDATAKDLRERGVWDPATGEFMITPAGQDKLRQADSLEATARTEKDSTKAAAQRDHAAALRESAKLNDAELAPDTERARKAAEANSASHAIYQKLADVREVLKGDPSVWDREKWAGIKTELGAIANEYASTIGERVSPRAMDAFVEHIAGFNADNLVSRAVSQGKAITAVEQLEKFVKTNSDARLKSLGIRSGWTPSAPNETSAEQTFKGKTSAEVGADATPGLITKAATGLKEAGKALLFPGDAASPGSSIGRRDPAIEAENATAGGNYGLDPKDESAARNLIAQANLAGDAKRRQIVDSLAQPIVDDKRPGLSGGITGVLRDADPRLLSEVLMRVSESNPKLGAQLIQLEQVRKQMPGSNLPPLPKVEK